MNRDDVARRIARQLPTHFLRAYALTKIRTDPVYAAVAERLRGSSAPLFDIGCGIGLMELYLRESGMTMPIIGIDHDTGKVEVARKIGARYDDLDFRSGDARVAIPPGSVLALDVLHYFSTMEQAALLQTIIAAVPPGGVAIIRDAVRDRSFRYRLTRAQEAFSRAVRWLKAERLNFPTRESIVDPFRENGFDVEVQPLWGRTPFNNYLFVFRRPESGSTSA